MGDDQPARFVDDPASDAGALLRRLPEPQPWSAARKQRVRAGIDQRLARARRRIGGGLAWSAVAAACFAAGVLVGARRSRAPLAPAIAGPTIATPANVAPANVAPANVAPAVAAPAVEPALVVASGHAELRGDRVVLGGGRVVVAARATPVTVELPDGRVRAEAGAVIEVRLFAGRVQVSAYRGRAAIETLSLGRHALAPGRTRAADGEHALAPAAAADIARALDGGPLAPDAPAAPTTPPHTAPPRASPPRTSPARTLPPRTAPPRPPAMHDAIAARAPVPPPAKLPLDDDPGDAPPPLPAPRPEPPAPAHAAAAAPLPSAPDPRATAPAAAPAAAPGVVSNTPAPPSAPPPVTVPTVAPPPSPSALAREAEDLRVAVRRLRHDHDAAGAIALLEAYLRHHPHGVLRTDAELARIDALLQIGDSRRALSALDHLPLDGLPRARELRVTRGELRAGAGRCRAALADFAAATDGSDGLAERALYRQAVCRAHLGDVRGARAGLSSYLGRFPAGRFAAEARRALAGH